MQKINERIVLTKDFLDSIPRSFGVYQFYSSNNTLLYIGKSVCLRARIKSHFRLALDQTRKTRMIAQTYHITWTETAGELGALLLEARLIKQQMPIFNIKLRKHKTLFALFLIEKPASYTQLVVNCHLPLHPHLTPMGSLFRRKYAAVTALRELIKNYHLCPKLAGLDNSRGACFSYQIKKCRGACIGEEKLKTYNRRVKKIFSTILHKKWPFLGRIAIKETHPLTGITEYHIFEKWCHLKTVSSLDGLAICEKEKTGPHFDLDVYHILSYYLENKRDQMEIIQL